MKNYYRRMQQRALIMAIFFGCLLLTAAIKKPVDTIIGSNLNNVLWVDGVKYKTVQAAITAACAASPGAPVHIPPGAFPQNSQFTLCDHLYLIGSGRATSDITTCPTTITTTQTAGDLFNVTALDQIPSCLRGDRKS